MKNLLQRWLAPKPRLTDRQAERLAVSQALPAPYTCRARRISIEKQTLGLWP